MLIPIVVFANGPGFSSEVGAGLFCVFCSEHVDLVHVVVLFFMHVTISMVHINWRGCLRVQR